MNKLTALYRNVDIHADKSIAPGITNNGGGTTTKIYHTTRALPSLKVINEIEEAGIISIAEILWFHELGFDEMLKRLDQWSALESFKMLMTSDVELLRLPGDIRDQLIDASDVILCLTQYVYNMFRAFTPKVAVLYDPIDIDMFKPQPKANKIFGSGQITVEKNVQAVIDIFDSLPDSYELDTEYIGSTNLWTSNSMKDEGAGLEAKLKAVCTRVLNNVPYTQMPDSIGQMWGYVADSRYDFSSYAMTEAMACGCWIFTGRHLMYDERPGERFKTTAEAVKLIAERLKSDPPGSGSINEEARQFVVDQNSYDNFRKQFKQIIGEVSLGL